jgi:hypothetical protein
MEFSALGLARTCTDFQAKISYLAQPMLKLPRASRLPNRWKIRIFVLGRYLKVVISGLSLSCTACAGVAAVKKLGVLDTSATGFIRKRGEIIRIPWNWYHSTCLFPPALLINPCTLFGRLRPQNSALAAGIAPNPNPTHGSLLHHNFIHASEVSYSGKCIWASSCFDSSAQTSLGSNNVSHIIRTLF